MKLKMKQNYECYIHTEFRKYKKNQVIENPCKYEIRMLLDKKKVAVLAEEKKPAVSKKEDKGKGDDKDVKKNGTGGKSSTKKSKK